MGICWYCYWGWPIPITMIYNEAVRRLDGDTSPLHFGPSHVVWEDENFNLAEVCLEDNDSWHWDNCTADELAIVRWSLEELAKLPMEMREEPEGYDEDDEHPELYPPYYEVTKIRGVC